MTYSDKRNLLYKMSQPRTLYILGAGTFYDLTPTTAQLSNGIIENYHLIGVYPIEKMPSPPIFNRVFGPISSGPPDIQKCLLSRMSSVELEFLTQLALYRPYSDIVPPQYAIFEKVGSPSVLFNYNLDELAARYCARRHIVLEPHGHIDSQWFAPHIYEELRDDIFMWGVRPPCSPKILISPEPENIIESSSFYWASSLFPSAPAMIIVGYSFGKQENGFDDAASYEFFISLLKKHRKPVFILGPSPDELAACISDRLSSHDVHGISTYWERFSLTALFLTDPIYGFRKKWTDREIDMLFD